MNGSLPELVDHRRRSSAEKDALKNTRTLKLAPERKSDTDNAFAIRHVYGNYVGQGSTIDVRAALGTESGDKNGTATVGVTSDALVLHGRATDGGDLTYVLPDGPIESGGFTYFTADTEAPDGGWDYILTSYGEDGVRTVSPDRGAFLGVAASTGRFGLSLHDRLGLRSYVAPSRAR